MSVPFVEARFTFWQVPNWQPYFSKEAPNFVMKEDFFQIKYVAILFSIARNGCLYDAN